MRKQISMFDVETRGIKSHWRWTGLTFKKCVMCDYLDTGAETPASCPGCKAIMIQPEPTRGGEQ